MQKLGPKTKAFFVAVLKHLAESRIPFLIGGGYAMKRHTDFERPARDLDVFILPSDAERVLRLFANLGYRTELTFPHWLGKIYKGNAYVDIIFSSGNGIVTVDDLWFKHAVEDVVFGLPMRVCPAEEMIWSKAFVMERERFDGADVIHLLLGRGPDLDWSRLLDRFQSYRLVLLSHLVLFLFVYPSERDRVPAWVWEGLLAALQAERRGSRDAGRICRGTLLSRGQYLEALERGYRDPRLAPEGTMRRRDVVAWTNAALEEGKAP
jgi:hypothetical protein